MGFQARNAGVDGFTALQKETKRQRGLATCFLSFYVSWTAAHRTQEAVFDCQPWIISMRLIFCGMHRDQATRFLLVLMGVMWLRSSAPSLKNLSLNVSVKNVPFLAVRRPCRAPGVLTAAAEDPGGKANYPGSSIIS